MKATTCGIVLALMLTFLSSIAAGQNNGRQGVVLGAGSGALIGQAIGRDTEATLLGTAVGGVLGYIIGNEMDKKMVIRQGSISQPQYSYEKNYRKEQRYSGKRKIVQELYYDEPICREAEILATVNNRPKKIVTTVCREDGEWVVQSDNDVRPVRKMIIEKTRYVQPTRVLYLGSPRHKHFNRPHKKHGKRYGRPWRRHSRYAW